MIEKLGWRAASGLLGLLLQKWNLCPMNELQEMGVGRLGPHYSQPAVSGVELPMSRGLVEELWAALSWNSASGTWIWQGTGDGGKCWQPTPSGKMLWSSTGSWGKKDQSKWPYPPRAELHHTEQWVQWERWG